VSHKAADGIYHLNSLKENVTAHVLAPLQPEKK
jgi:hypothetical protein